MEELKIKIEKIDNNKDNELDTQMNITKKELEKIKTELDNAVKEQNFELAAKLRDKIKEMEGGKDNG